VLAGCGHGDAFQVATAHPTGPLVPGPVALLTYSSGRSHSPAWAADGILYTYQDSVGGPAQQWCLGRLPPTGGSRVAQWCEVVPDSQIAYDWAATSPTGRLAYLRAAGHPRALAPDSWWVMVADGGNPWYGAPTTRVLITLPGAPAQQGVEQLRWLDSTRLVWVADTRVVGSPCRGCPVDTVASGRMLVTQDVGRTVSANLAAPIVLAGTDYATSVAVRGGDELFFTLGGDARVYRRAVSTGATTVVWDFGVPDVVRDVQIAGDRMVAILGGAVSFGYDASAGDSLQRDGGGDIVVVDLVSGVVQVIALPFPVRHPALSPDGRQVVVETGTKPEALYLVALP